MGFVSSHGSLLDGNTQTERLKHALVILLLGYHLWPSPRSRCPRNLRLFGHGRVEGPSGLFAHQPGAATFSESTGQSGKSKLHKARPWPPNRTTRTYVGPADIVRYSWARRRFLQLFGLVTEHVCSQSCLHMGSAGGLPIRFGVVSLLHDFAQILDQ